MTEGPSVRFHSKKGQTNRLSFSDHFAEVPSVINQPGTRYRRRCVVRTPHSYAFWFSSLFGSTHPLLVVPLLLVVRSTEGLFGLHSPFF